MRFLSGRRSGPTAGEAQEAAVQACREFLSGASSGTELLARLHRDLGHEGPEHLQDLVELDDEYLFGNDPGAERRFREDRVMELLVRRAPEVVDEQG